MRRPTGLLLVAAAVVLGSCTYMEAPGPYQASVPTPPPGVDLGPFLYQRDCAWCHGDSGAGTSRAPDLVTGTNGPAFTDFVLRTGRMPIRSPDEPVRRSTPIYSEEQIDELTAYVASLGGRGPAVPRVHPERGDLHRGLELYEENCAACHSTTGAGGALTGGDPGESGIVAPGLWAVDATETAEAVLVGPGTMPVFELSDEELDSLVSYVLYLRTPQDAGGAPIGRIGPVAEGAVGWVIGLGAMLVLARVIGTRRET